MGIRNNDPLTTVSVKKNRSSLSYLGVIVRGFCMGAADVIPGVSGGTMALILGIYEELVKAIRSFDLTFLKHLISLRIRDAMDHADWQFVVAVALGIFMAIFSLARILSWILQNWPVSIWSFFFGLVLSSVFMVGRNLDKWSAPNIVWAVLGAAGAYILVGMVPVSTPDAPWFLFISGAVAVCAMILPGISGAFILVLLGKYQYVLEAVNNRDMLTLLLVATGGLFGLIAFSRLLNWLLRRHRDLMIAVLAGLMLGSLRKVWPWKKTLQSTIDVHGNSVPLTQANILPPQWDSEVITAICLMVLGLLVVFSLSLWVKRKKGT